jgi:hypothetical protein
MVLVDYIGILFTCGNTFANKNHSLSYKHNEQINSQNIDNSGIGIFFTCGNTFGHILYMYIFFSGIYRIQ